MNALCLFLLVLHVEVRRARAGYVCTAGAELHMCLLLAFCTDGGAAAPPHYWRPRFNT